MRDGGNPAMTGPHGEGGGFAQSALESLPDDYDGLVAEGNSLMDAGSYPGILVIATDDGWPDGAQQEPAQGVSTQFSIARPGQA